MNPKSVITSSSMGPSQKGCAGTLLHCQLRSLQDPGAYPGQYRSAPALSSNKEKDSFVAVNLLQMFNHSGPHQEKHVPFSRHVFPRAQVEMIRWWLWSGFVVEGHGAVRGLCDQSLKHCRLVHVLDAYLP